MRRTTRPLSLFAAAGFGLLLVGCGIGLREKRLPETGATLEGTVSYGTDKVEVAMVIIQGENGSATAFVGEDGRYKAENVPTGEVNIGVSTDAGKGQIMGKVAAQSQGKGQGPLPKMVNVPVKYAEPATSGIKTTVNKGANTFDIVIPR